MRKNAHFLKLTLNTFTEIKIENRQNTPRLKFYGEFKNGVRIVVYTTSVDVMSISHDEERWSTTLKVKCSIVQVRYGDNPDELYSISMMATVALIGIRMDLYAVIYSIWLCILFSMKRSLLAKIWVFYLIFIAILLPVQYFMAVGLPPTLCQVLCFLLLSEDLDKYSPSKITDFIRRVNLLSEV
ncbi:hypothetical protein NQ315_003646 [Exocentrus adspersus]|uniref:Uncharacterized protein n=1 Tax=Exocentrus adspersus TaxID=1586481 RepID=A0AAV8VBS5_9CUCU|nr:hypothetical protein NQ315_003646 [Exocentrus adspersus]